MSYPHRDWPPTTKTTTFPIQSFLQQIFIKKLLCVKYCALEQDCQEEEQSSALEGQQYLEDRGQPGHRG